MPPAEAAGLKIPCATPQQLQAELDALAVALEPEEREDTWEKFEKAVIRFAGVTRGGGYKHLDVFVRGVGNKGVGLRLVDCMMSDRGRLSGVSTDLLQTMAPRLGLHFAPLVHLYLPPLVRLLARPNKIYLRRADKCLTTIIHHCPLPTILIHLRHGLDDRSDNCKRASAIGVETMLEHWESSRFHERDLEVLELCVRKMATDRDSEVRKTAKRVWAQFMDLWPERVEDFTDPLTPTIRRYLDIPAGDAPAKPKPRAALRPRPAAATAAAKDAPLGAPMSTNPRNGHAAHPPREAPAAVAGPSRSRPTSRNVHAEEHPRVVSGHSRPAEHAPASRSASHGVLNHMSSSSSLGSAGDSVRQHVLSKPSRPALYVKEKDTESGPSRRMAAPTRTVSASSEPSDSRGDEPSRPQRGTHARHAAMRPLPKAWSSSESLPQVSGSAPATSEQSSPMPSVKERVSEFEKKGGDMPSVFRLSPSKRDLAIAAAVPLPADTPTSTKPAVPGKAAESPSLSMLLQRGRAPPEGGNADMPTLLDLSVDVTAVARDAVPRRQLSQTLREPSPSPGTVAGLIGKFSGTPGSATPGRANRSNSLSTPSRSGSSRSSETTAHLVRAHTGSSVAEGTPTPVDRRISPLPRRRSRLSDEPPSAASPPRRLKRKSSNDFDAAPAAVEVEAEAPPPRAPRFSQPLIAFSDTPSRRQSIRPFVFGGSYGAGVFDDLMMIQTGEDIAEENEDGDELANVMAGLEMGEAAQEVEAEAEGAEADETVRAELVDLGESEPHGEAAECAADAEPAVDLLKDAEPVVDLPTDAEPVVDLQTGSPETQDEPEYLETPEQPHTELVAEVTEAAEEATVTPAEETPTTFDEKVLEKATEEEELLAEPENAVLEPEHVKSAADDEPAVGDEPAAEPAAEPESAAEPENAVVPEQTAVETEETHDAVDKDPATLPKTEQTKPGPAVVEAAHELLRTVAAAKTESGASRPTRNAAPAHSTASRTTTSRLGPPSRAPPPRAPRPAVPAATEKRSFRPVSRLGPGEGGKAAPAPARLAMATKASAAKAAGQKVTPATSASTTATASTSASASAAASKPASKPTSRHTSRAASPVAETDEALGASQSSAGSRKPTRSNLLKPTAAAAARAAANAETAASKPRVVSGSARAPVAPAARAAPAPAPAAAPAPAPAPRRAGAAFGSTASSRARAEAALPPVKRQRVKLKAPMESFRPGRARANPSKTAMLGSNASAPSAPARRPRAMRKDVKGAVKETFPLPGPGLDPPKEDVSAAEDKKPATAALAIPIPSSAPNAPDDTQGPARTPTTLSPLGAAAASLALSPTSSRVTDRSDASVRSGSSPRKIRAAGVGLTPTRALDPVLTPLHSRVAATGVSPDGAESAATVHTRRMSTWNFSTATAASASASATPRAAAPADVFTSTADVPAAATYADADAPTHVPRHDVSTPPAKAAAALLAKFGALHIQNTPDTTARARAALTPKDANRDLEE